MIALFLGFLFLAAWAFSQARQQWSLSLDRYRPSKDADKFSRFFAQALFRAVALALPHQFQAQAFSQIKSQKRNIREGLLEVCLAPAGVFFWVLLLAAVFQLAGGYFLIFGAVAAMIGQRPAASWAWMIFFGGLFLHAVEMSVRMGGFLVQDPGYQDFVFWLADNRWPAMITWLLVAVLLTFAVRFEGWSWLVALGALALGIMGLNTAMVLVLGESLAWSLILFFKWRRSGAAGRRWSSELSFLVAVEVILFLVVFGFWRSGGGMNISPDFVVERLWTFLACALIWSVFSTLGLCVWGHFRAR